MSIDESRLTEEERALLERVVACREVVDEARYGEGATAEAREFADLVKPLLDTIAHLREEVERLTVQERAHYAERLAAQNDAAEAEAREKALREAAEALYSVLGDDPLGVIVREECTHLAIWPIEAWQTLGALLSSSPVAGKVGRHPRCPSCHDGSGHAPASEPQRHECAVCHKTFDNRDSFDLHHRFYMGHSYAPASEPPK